MVNSIGGGNASSFSSSIAVGDGCGGGGGGNVVDRPAVTNKDRVTLPKSGRERSASPSAAAATPSLLCEAGLAAAAARTTADGGVLRRLSIDAERKDAMTATAAAPSTTTTTTTDLERARGVYCSLPLEKVQGLFGAYASQRKPVTKKLLCLYCDRSFVTTNLRQKHVDRCHSPKQVRRQSSRRNQSQAKLTPCAYCDTVDTTDLNHLFVHLATAHPKKYFACVPCAERFPTAANLTEHNAETHPGPEEKLTRSKQKQQQQQQQQVGVAKMFTATTTTMTETTPVTDNSAKNSGGGGGGGVVKKTVSGGREVKNKKLAVKSTKMGVKRSARLQSKSGGGGGGSGGDGSGQKVQRKQKGAQKTEENVMKTSTSINPYPQFDSFFQVKKITDHSIDNLRISTLTFEDVVFDKAFYNRIKCNIQENLLNHIDGKLFKNEESESRISNFEKVATHHQEFPNNPAMLENYGCDISLNAATPVAMLLSTQFGEDLESQIEYGSKASKKKTQTRTEELPYKYFTRRKYQASILESKENRDLSKLDMWTQLIIKNRQQKIAHDKKSPKELLDYAKGQEYKNKLQQEELNRILDKRGPFEDLKEEASKKAAFDKLSSGDDAISQENFAVVTDVLAEVVQRVCEKLAKEEEETTAMHEDSKFLVEKNENMEIPSYLKLKRCCPTTENEEIDRSDRITLICSSQETENFDVPNATVRCKDEMVELTGEWARTRIYICAACGLKVSNLKQLLEHKGVYHQNVWCQHYEFVGNQSELYRHLSIPGLGKVGQVEGEVKCKVWQRSEARVCSKCTKQCHTLGELHRHVLECGGDWSWMLARKKCKYRPFGAKTRRKRRGLVKRIINPQQKPKEKKRYKKRFEGPRQKPSDADTIQRMLANLPPKRATRKIMSLKDGFQKPAKSQVKVKNKVKCGKVICKQTVEAKTKEKKKEEKENVRRKSLRRISKVLSSRILDTNKTLVVRRKIKSAINSVSQKNNIPEVNKSKKSPKRQEKQAATIVETPSIEQNTEKPKTDSNKTKKKPSSLVKNGQVNIKNFFPVTKNPNKMKHNSENNDVVKKSKLDSVGNFVRTLSMRKAKVKAQKPKKQKTNKPKSSLKRKLQSTLQSAVKKVKSVGQKKQTDVEAKEFFRGQDDVAENKEDDDKMPLLEKVPDTPEKCDLPADLPILTPVVLSFEAPPKNCEFSPAEETKIDEELEEITEETVPCRIMNDPPKIIPCTKQKNKLKKPNRGLNDCIAMLTNKLQQQVVVNEPFSKPIFSFPNVIVPSIVQKDDFDSTIEDEAYEVLDLSKKLQEESEKAAEEPVVVEEKPIFEASALLMSNVEVIENAVKTHLARKQLPRRVSSRKIGQKREKPIEVPKKVLLPEPFVEFSDTQVFEEKPEKCEEANVEDFSLVPTLEDEKLLESSVESKEGDLDRNDEAEEIKIVEQFDKISEPELEIQETELNEDIEEDKELLPSVEEIKTAEEPIETEQESTTSKYNEISDAATSLTVQTTIEDEDEEITLENKSILKINPTTLTTPSDSEDEVPLSELRRSLCKTKPDEAGASTTAEEEETVDAARPIFEEISQDEDLTTKDTTESDYLFTNEEQSVSTREDVATGDTCLEVDLEKPVRILRSRSVNAVEQKLAESSCDSSLLNDLSSKQEDFRSRDGSETQEVVEAAREVRSRKNMEVEDESSETNSVRLLRSRTSSTKDSESETAFTARRTSTRQQKDKQKTEKGVQPEIQKEETLQDSTNLTSESKKSGSRKVAERKNGIIKHDNPFEYLDTWDSDAQSSEWLFKSALKAQEQNSMLVPTLLAKPDEPVKQQTKPKTKSNSKRKKKSVSNDSNIENKEFFCDICSKSFMRNDSLTKHYRTLIHIAKLSEIEAKQAAENKLMEESPKRDEINLCNMLQESEKYVESKITSDVPLLASSFALNTTNSNTLKLADIINDVLNKPVEENSNKHSSNNFSDILQTAETKLKRCKSLGERKSFESDNVKSSNVVDFTDNFGSSTLDNNIFAKTTSCADSLLEKQISLLENMIENRTSLNYIDDISVSSENNSARNSPSEISSIADSKDYSNNAANTKKVDLEKDTNNFIKPVQYEEISEDSGNYANNFEEQKSRKTLNRDEELFLECCSLLKSGSEVSSYSKESSKIKSFHLKPAYEADWPEHKSFSVQCQMNDTSHFMSDTSRIPTPLGDNFAGGGCSSNTVSFDLKNKTENEPQKGDIVMFEDISEDKSLQGQSMIAEKSSFNFSFQFTETDEPSKGQEADIEDLADKEDSVKNKVSEKLSGMVASIKNKFTSLKRKGKRRKKKLTVPSVSDTGSGSSDEETDATADNLKVATKGALKVFEGLKVSIRREDIDLTQVLNKKPAAEDEKVLEPIEEKKPLPPSPIKTQKKNGQQKNFKLQTKLGRTEALKKGNKTTYDVYDFEETQDNSDVFFVNPLSNYRTFRTQIETQEKPPTPAKETETSTCTDTLSYEAVSVSSTSTVSNVSEKKPKMNKNITKKKCMIMGRIFKNALKSKVDDDIREIPEVANEKLVNDYVLSCPLPETPKVTMSQEEMDRLFNNLLEGGKQENNDAEVKNTKIEANKTVSNKQKPQLQKSVKPKKRHRTISESTDDEFSIAKPVKKRAYKKSDKKTDNSINLEQELKECIGVASRKSQRKCTSGKQNVLVEFWSSDESVSEAVLEVKPIGEEKPAQEPVKEVVEEETAVVATVMEKMPGKEEQKVVSEPPKTQKKQKKVPTKPKPNKAKTKEVEKLKVTEPVAETLAANRRKRASVNTLYYWSSSSEDELQDLIEVKSIRDEFHDDEDRPMQHGWIVGDSPKKLVTMLAQAKGKKTDLDSVKEQAKNRTSVMCS